MKRQQGTQDSQQPSAESSPFEYPPGVDQAHGISQRPDRWSSPLEAGARLTAARPTRAATALALGVLMSVWLPAVAASVQFEDLTSSAGPFPNLESWGATARDYDGDGLIDIFVNNHRQRPALLRNQGNGQFIDVTLSVDKSDLWVDRPRADMHGAAWIDLDNDGWQDLWNATGTCCDAHLLINQGGYFVDEAISYDVHEDSGGRGVNPVDLNDDAWPDAIANYFNLSRAKVFDPVQGVFRDSNPQTGFECGNRTSHIHVADFSTDGRADILCVNESRLDKLYDISDYAISGQPFVDLSDSMPTIWQVPDTAIGDFDGNGQTDVFLLRGLLRQAGIKVFGPGGERAEGLFAISSGKPEVPHGFVVQGGERIRVKIHSEQFGTGRINIGGTDGFNPSANTFTLDSSDPQVRYDGTLDHDINNGHQLYIAYNLVDAAWDFVGFGKSAASVRAYVEIENLGTTGFSNPVLLRERAGNRPRAPSLLMNTDGVFTEEASLRGLDEKINCAGVVTADFDADMDLDLFAVCRTAVSNEANLLFLNDGSGNFSRQAAPSGAEGPIGSAVVDEAGTADSVVTADFDGDGFVDLYVVNGLNLQPDRLGAQSYYYRNLGNSNNWLQLDLAATRTSRDAVGAKVFVTAGGVTQLREQDNGYHRWSQNSHRLHFGLADNPIVDLIKVEWPSGGVSEFSNIDASAIYTITEGIGSQDNGTISALVLGPAPPLPGPLPGDECGEPRYDYDFDPELLVWRDCSTNVFHLRAKGGRQSTTTRYRGRLRGSAPLASITAVGLTNDDSVDNGSDPSTAEFDLKVRFTDDTGLTLDATGQTLLCLELDVPADDHILVGQRRWAAKSPLNLLTLGSCDPNARTVSIEDVSVNEDAGVAVVAVRLSAPAVGGSVFVDYATADDTATAGLDYEATSGTAEIAEGQSQTTFEVALLDDALSEGAESLQLSLSNAVGASLGDGSAVLTILDDEGLDPCSKPPFDSGSESGLFLWRNCDATGPDAVWQVRVTGGGGAPAIYAGTVTADTPLTASRVRLEGDDLLDTSPGDGIVDYALQVGGAGVDGFELRVPLGNPACFGADNLPTGAEIRIGAGRNVLAAPFGLTTLQVCGN